MSVSVSNYPQDFQPADPAAFEPVDLALFLGVHPPLLLLLAALVLGLMVLAYRSGKGGATAQPDAAESIWRAIDRACQAAMTANSDALTGAAKTLRATLDDCLGAVVVLADGPAKPLKAIDNALKGRIKETVKPKDEAHDPATKPAPPPAPDKPADKPADREVERDMTKPEQLAALREAVAQFNDHWCRREERIRELRAAHRQLSTPRPGGASGHGVGARH